jgi:hypothetical protein
MPLHVMPAHNPYQKLFKLFAGTAIVLLLAILCISIWTPAGLNDEIRRALAWIAGVIVVIAVVGGQWLGSKEGLWKIKQGLQIEVSDGKVIQTRPGSPTLEIPLDQINSLHQSRSWLIVRGGEPEKCLAVPTDIAGFEDLRREIAVDKTISPLMAKTSVWLILAAVSFCVALFFLFTSSNRVVIVTSGGAALLFQAFMTYPLRPLLRSSRKVAALFLFAYILEVLVVAWIAYQHAFRF